MGKCGQKSLGNSMLNSEVVWNFHTRAPTSQTLPLRCWDQFHSRTRVVPVKFGLLLLTEVLVATLVAKIFIHFGEDLSVMRVSFYFSLKLNIFLIIALNPVRFISNLTPNSTCNKDEALYSDNSLI